MSSIQYPQNIFSRVQLIFPAVQAYYPPFQSLFPSQPLENLHTSFMPPFQAHIQPPLHGYGYLPPLNFCSYLYPYGYNALQQPFAVMTPLRAVGDSNASSSQPSTSAHRNNVKRSFEQKDDENTEQLREKRVKYEEQLTDTSSELSHDNMAIEEELPSKILSQKQEVLIISRLKSCIRRGDYDSFVETIEEIGRETQTEKKVDCFLDSNKLKRDRVLCRVLEPTRVVVLEIFILCCYFNKVNFMQYCVNNLKVNSNCKYIQKKLVHYICRDLIALKSQDMQSRPDKKNICFCIQLHSASLAKFPLDVMGETFYVDAILTGDKEIIDTVIKETNKAGLNIFDIVLQIIDKYIKIGVIRLLINLDLNLFGELCIESGIYPSDSFQCFSNCVNYQYRDPVDLIPAIDEQKRIINHILSFFKRIFNQAYDAIENELDQFNNQFGNKIGEIHEFFHFIKGYAISRFYSGEMTEEQKRTAIIEKMRLINEENYKSLLSVFAEARQNPKARAKEEAT